MSNGQDRPFIPFNFSTVVPFDSLAVALNELPTPQLAEPEGEFTSFACHELPTTQPSPAIQAEMLKLMTETARDGEWGRIETPLPSEMPPSRQDWTSSFCHQLNASLRHVQKRDSIPSPTRPTPKRPRHSPPAAPTPPAPPANMSPTTRSSAGSPRKFPEKRRLAVRKDVDVPEEVSHKRETRMRQMLKDVDADEFNDFVAYLQRFQRRPQSFLKQTDDLDEAKLLASSSQSAITELRQRVLLAAKKGAIQHADPELLSSVISILEKRIFESSRACTLVENGDISKQSTYEATLGVLSAAAVLGILSAPGSPRRLLVEELLDEIASLLKSCATLIIFPLCDPLYTHSKPAKRRKKNQKNQRISGKVDSAPDLSDETAGEESDQDAKRAMTSRRTLLKKDEALLDFFSVALDALSTLLEKERHLPDSVVSTVASTCLQSLSVTGIAGVQLHAMKAACTVFQYYPHHRLPMLDDVREAASRVPAARRHLRSFKLAEYQTSVRASSALLAQFLCAATNEPTPKPPVDANGNATMDADSTFTVHRKHCYDQVVKLSMHALDPLLRRAYNGRDVEYRAAFQALLEDILTMYGRPEWPSAELILQTISVSVITRLRSRDEKSVYARTFAVDILGSLAAKMCEIYGSDILREGAELSAEDSFSEQLEPDRERLLLYLDPERSRQFASARNFCEARFISDDYGAATNLVAESKRAVDERKRMDEETPEDVLDGQEGSNADERSLRDLVTLRAAGRAKRVTERRFKGEEISRSSATDATVSIGRARSFTAAVRTILEAILDGMNDSAPTTRARSIKALSSIDEACNGIVQAVPSVLKFIEGSCRDVSTLTRDAALDLLGRSLLPNRDWSSLSKHTEQPQDNKEPEPDVRAALLAKIFSIVEKRLCDTATSVRKRAIAILKTALSHALEGSEMLRSEPMKSIESMKQMRQHETRIIQICASLVTRLDDPETTVREAAERTVRLGLFGFDISQQIRIDSDNDAASASQLATRFVTVFARLPSGIHVSFISRVVHKALLVKHRTLISLIVNAVVDQMQDCEANMARVLNGKEVRSLSNENLEKLRPISVRRVACASVIFAFGGLDDSLVVPHCRSLAPSIKGVNELGTSENDLICVQKVLNLLEIGFKRSEEFDRSFLEEVIHDVEFIVCTSPLSILEEASVKCFCAIAKRMASDRENPLMSAADTFHSFLVDNMDSLKPYCEGTVPEKPTAMERNARGAFVRLGLLLRYGVFDSDFVSKVYRTFETACAAISKVGHRDLLQRAVVRALSHFLVRHRSYLSNGTTVLVTVWSATTNKASALSCSGRTANEGIHLAILQGFHDLLRDEEDRNSTGSNNRGTANAELRASVHERVKGRKSDISSDLKDTNERKAVETREEPVLAAEEDAEAGFVALSAQAMLPSFKSAVNSYSTVVRRMVANILGLLVRQGLLLPATVVTELFTLLLDRDQRCREYAHRVVAFLADRHSGMLASAATSALRVCFENSFVVNAAGKEKLDMLQEKIHVGRRDEANCTDAITDVVQIQSPSIPSVEEIKALTIDERTGQSLLSQALMTMRREQRRGVFESMMREFDPRVVLLLDSSTENSNETRVQEDEMDHKLLISSGKTGIEVSDRLDSEEDDVENVGNVGSSVMDLSAAEPRCSLPILYFMAATLACVDYTNGAGVGGSLVQGGGTAAAETKLKYAKEDVTELVGLATRVISISGQAILRLAMQLRKTKALGLERKLKIAYYASRMSILLDLKHHLKVERWKSLLSSDEAKEEAEASSSNCKMPSFALTGSLPAETSWDASVIPQITEEAADLQLDLFCRQMKEDAIDDADIAVPTRKGSRAAKRRTSSRKISSTPTRRKGPSLDTQSPRRLDHPIRSSAKKKLFYGNADSDDGGSDYDPMTQ